MKVVAAWSGGKDSCYAYYKALNDGLEVISLLTFMQNEDLSNFHAIKSELLHEQAQALSIPMARYITNPDSYEKQFKDALVEFKAKGAKGLVTGDIYEVAGHEKGWLERVCAEVDLQPIRPLWQGDTTRILADFIGVGFKATVVRTKLDVLNEEWLGRELNGAFLKDILKMPNVDPCGEGGEYHTVVTDGPVFRESLKLLETRKMSGDGYGRLEIVRFKKMRK